MKAQNVFFLLLVMSGMAFGQILFKLGARSFAGEGPLLRKLLSPYLVAGIALYGIVTIVWVWQLSMVDLNRAYPFMALTFVVVPLLSMLVLGETVNARYWIGVACIILGIAVVQSAP